MALRTVCHRVLHLLSSVSSMSEGKRDRQEMHVPAYINSLGELRIPWVPKASYNGL